MKLTKIAEQGVAPNPLWRCFSPVFMIIITFNPVVKIALTIVGRCTLRSAKMSCLQNIIENLYSTGILSKRVFSTKKIQGCSEQEIDEIELKI